MLKTKTCEDSDVDIEKVFDVYKIEKGHSDLQKNFASLYGQGEDTQKNIDNTYKKIMGNGCQEVRKNSEFLYSYFYYAIYLCYYFYFKLFKLFIKLYFKFSLS